MRLHCPTGRAGWLFVLAFSSACITRAQIVPSPSDGTPAVIDPPPALPVQPDPSLRDEAEEQLKLQEQQRIMRVVPNFYTALVPDPAPLSSGQKFRLAFRGAVDPFEFVMAGIDAGFSQARNGFSGYGQGAQGYGKRFGASYVDSFDSAMLGNALLPSLLHQDPRYFRKGTGSFAGRFLYAVSTVARCKSDKGKWVPNYSDIVGELAAGGISNLYYPSANRGAELTFQRAFTQLAEGGIGAVFFEFWPDISRKFFHGH